jgi:hypothetical protein
MSNKKKSFSIKIISCKNSNFWYANYIGKIYSAVHCSSSDYYLPVRDKHINKESCEVINEKQKTTKKCIVCNSNKIYHMSKHRICINCMSRWDVKKNDKI